METATAARPQLNPPFDGSVSCPACSVFSRDGGHWFAYLHNFLTRCDVKAGRVRESKAFVKLNDMRLYGKVEQDLTEPHPVTQEMLEVARALVAACDGMVDEGLRITWTPEVRERVEALIPRVAAAMDAFIPFERAHRADERHARGEENVLRQSAGSAWAGFVNPDYAAAGYDYTVEVVSAGADITHTVCGTGLKLHEHFKANIARDPTFYGKVWCPTCSGNVPFRQFTCTIQD